MNRGQTLTNSNRELASEADLEGWIMHGLMDTEAQELIWGALPFGYELLQGRDFPLLEVHWKEYWKHSLIEWRDKWDSPQ